MMPASLMKSFIWSGVKSWACNFLTATGAPRHDAKYTVPYWPLNGREAKTTFGNSLDVRVTVHVRKPGSTGGDRVYTPYN